MIVKTVVSSLWTKPNPAAMDRLAAILGNAPDGTGIFFRADDIGVPGDNCRRMMEIHRKHGVPLHMAVTPAWLSGSRWALLKEWAGDDGLFCWHQHGWRHQNHQKRGKKGEFGPDRSWAEKENDLVKGRARLEAVMGEAFQPFFTPPWNRFDAETGQILSRLGYRAVSRSTGEMKKVPLPETLPDLFINVDLHTRGEDDPDAGWHALMDEFEAAAATGRIGVMLHHQRMNSAALDFLDALLAACAATALKQIRFDQP